MNRPLAVVTGASAGIGAVFARKLAQRNYDLLLIARREDRLRQLAGELGHASYLVADLAEAEGLQRAADRVAAEPTLSLLVNNAGFGTQGRFWEIPFADQERMHRLHIDATMKLTRAALPGMVQRNAGAIINVSSVASFARSPGSVSYCATKSWMSVFTEGLYLELKNVKSSVVVQALCPGFTYSEFHDVMGGDRSKIAKWLWLDTDRVVEDSLNALASGKLYVIPGWQYKLLCAVMPRVPTALRLMMESVAPHKRDQLRQ